MQYLESTAFPLYFLRFALSITDVFTDIFFFPKRALHVAYKSQGKQSACVLTLASIFSHHRVILVS